DYPPMTDNSRETLLPAYFGEFGGQFVPESLIPALEQLEKSFVDAMADESFQKELADLLRDYLGRPTPITEVHKLGGKARIFLKRETLSTAALTRPTRFWVRRYWLSAWAKPASLPKPVRANTARQRLLRAHSWTLIASCTWALKTSHASNPTFSVWNSWAQKSCPLIPAPAP